MELSFAPHPKTVTPYYCLVAGKEKRYLVRMVCLSVLGTLWAATACILLSQRPKKHKGQVRGTAAAETATPAEHDAEGGDKQLERDRDVRARSAAGDAVVSSCPTDAAADVRPNRHSQGWSSPCGVRHLLAGGCRPFPGARSVVQSTAACWCPAAALGCAVHPLICGGLPGFPLEQRSLALFESRCVDKPSPMALGVKPFGLGEEAEWRASTIPCLGAPDVFFPQASLSKGIQSKIRAE